MLLADGIFKVLAVLFRDDLWRLNPLEKKDLAQAITGWVYAQPKRRAMYVIKFFTDVAPTLTLFLTVGGIMEVRLRTQAAKRNLMRTMMAAQRVPPGQGQPAATTRGAYPPTDAPPAPAVPVMPMPRMDGTIEVPERPDMPMNPLEELQAQLPM